MKPLNLDNRPCSPISSNCVIWQGPELTCINLCKGDTISDVVANLATELCGILDQLDVSNYDLTCFGITACGPANFEALIKLLIERICALEGAPTDTTRSDGGCPDCLVTVASCFIQNGQTTMQLIDYVNMIAERVCGLINSINDLQQQIDELTIRVEILENTPPPVFVVPTVTFSCAISTLNPGQPYPIDVALQTFINNVWCPMADALGTPSDLLNSYTLPCSFDTDVTTNPNWTPAPTTLAESMTNVWIVLCDLYSIISGLTLNVQDTSTINLNLTAGVLIANVQDTGWKDLDGFAYYTGAETLAIKPQARRIGNVVHFRGTLVVPINDGAGAPLLWQIGSAPPVDTYYLSTVVAPATVGPSSVLLNAAGLVTFNQGISVIPASIMAVGETFDNNYALSNALGSRPCQVNASPATSTILTGLFNVSIRSNKTLLLSLPKNGEQNSFSGTAAFDTSHLNYIISHVTAEENVPSFSNANTNVNSNPGSGNIPLVLAYSATNVYPFSCNANNEQQVGGFRIQLDGLIAYINPCTTDIPTPILCP